MFYNTNVTFYNVPSKIGNLTNAVDEEFFYYDTEDENEHLKSIRGIFQNSNIQPYDTSIFSHLIALEDCNACFMNCKLGTFHRSFAIDELWQNNPNLKTVAGCFLGVRNVTVSNTIHFHNDVTSIDISSLFGISSGKEDSETININIHDMYVRENNSVRTITTNNYFRGSEILLAL